MRRHAPLLVVLLGVAGIAALGGWLYSREALFRVRSIEVRLQEGPLKQKLEESLVSYSGRSMFALKLGELEQSLLKNPEVKGVRILRRWPNTLVIETELKRKTALEFRERGLWFLDDSGEVISRLTHAEALPLVWGFEGEQVLKAEVLKWIADNRSSDDLLMRLDEISYDGDVALGFKNLGLKVHLGGRNWSERWARAKAAFVAMQKQGRLAVLMDASVDGRVFVYDSVELHNSQSGLNLRELVRRTRDSRAFAR